jgi:Domain of unknown function (DUF4394)
VAAGDQAATQVSPAQHQESRPHRPAQPFLAVGLTTDQTLVAFASNNPTKLTTLGRVRGLAGDRRLVGLDCRVADSTAYGVGDRGGIYRLRLGDATATTLFIVDPSRDQVAIRSPANAGLLAATGTLGVDADAGSDAGFDIHYSADGAAADERGLAALKVRGT